MFGREYLDWESEAKAAAEIDRFLADMEPEDRVWALAVLRKRFEVRVEYRDNSRILQDYASNALARQNAQARLTCGQQHYRPAFGGAFGGLFN